MRTLGNIGCGIWMIAYLCGVVGSGIYTYNISIDGSPKWLALAFAGLASVSAFVVLFFASWLLATFIDALMPQEESYYE